MKRKIELMHYCFGKDEKHKCRDCDNLIKQIYNRTYYKCSVYGETDSEASDWRLKYTACGMFNKEYNGRPIIELRRHCGGKPEPEPELDGQMTF